MIFIQWVEQPMMFHKIKQPIVEKSNTFVHVTLQALDTLVVGAAVC